MDKLKTIKENCLALASAKANANEAKGISNLIIGQSVYIHLQGTIHDKAALNRFIAKGAEGEKFKSVVSKGKTIANAAKDGTTFILRDSEVLASVITEATFENLPEVTFTALYNSLNAANKGDKESKARNKQALELGAEANGMTVKEVQALSDDDKAVIMQQGEAILAELEAQESTKVSVETFDKVIVAIAAMTSAEREAIINYIAELESEAQVA